MDGLDGEIPLQTSFIKPSPSFYFSLLLSNQNSSFLTRTLWSTVTDLDNGGHGSMAPVNILSQARSLWLMVVNLDWWSWVCSVASTTLCGFILAVGLASRFVWDRWSWVRSPFLHNLGLILAGALALEFYYGHDLGVFGLLGFSWLWICGVLMVGVFLNVDLWFWWRQWRGRWLWVWVMGWENEFGFVIGGENEEWDYGLSVGFFLAKFVVLVVVVAVALGLDYGWQSGFGFVYGKKIIRSF